MYALEAASNAWSSCSRLQSGASAWTSPVAGFSTPKVDGAAQRSPPMVIDTSVMGAPSIDLTDDGSLQRDADELCGVGEPGKSRSIASRSRMRDCRMATPRRMGTETSETRGRLLDVTEHIMLDDGYAAVSSRRVAKDAGVTAALVHYYFGTLDDLFLAAPSPARRSRARTSLRRVVSSSQQPLRALWEAASDPHSDRPSAHGVHGPRKPPQGHPDRTRRIRRAVPGDPAEGPRGSRRRSWASTCHRWCCSS